MFKRAFTNSNLKPCFRSRVQNIYKYYGIPMDDPDSLDKDRAKLTREYRFIYPEFLPNNTDWTKKNKLCEYLERQDMIKRRKIINIPEFYVGTIMRVTVSDPYAPDKPNKFMGICIARGEHGLRHYFILRNMVDGLGCEIFYELYNPTILSIEIIKLEKRLDDHLLYLRDALPQYSTFDVDMPKVFHSPNDPVPLNPIKVELKPRPWSSRWEAVELRGVQDFTHYLNEKQIKRVPKFHQPWLKFDIMQDYRTNITKEEQEEIFSVVKENEPHMKGYKKPQQKTITKQNPSIDGNQNIQSNDISDEKKSI